MSTPTTNPWLSGVVFVATLVAFVVLTISGYDTGGLVALAGPVIGALFVIGAVGSQLKANTAPMSEKLDTVQRQTNGALTGGIQTAVNAGIAEALPIALKAAGVLPSPPVHVPAHAAASPAAEGPSTSTMPPGFTPSAAESVSA